VGDNVKVELTADHAEEGMAGDVVEVTAERAETLRRAGVAKPATVADAKALGEEPEAAASKTSKGSGSSKGGG
jgi:hypothetical protein